LPASNGSASERVCAISLRNIKRASKRTGATLTIEVPDAVAEQLIAQMMDQPTEKTITHLWLAWNESPNSDYPERNST
jgi:hypothetical protein